MDGRSQTVDLVHIGFFDALQELTRIGRKRFDIAALSLGINRVEGQRTFARARDAADHRQLAVGNLAGNVFQVVRPRTADDNSIIQREGTGKKTFRSTKAPTDGTTAKRITPHYRTLPPLEHSPVLCLETG
jgi:hypothetical protein